jgi:hypothetical protein
MSSRVFVTQEVTTANYTDLDRWGESVFLTASEVSNVRTSVHNRKLVHVIRSKLETFDPKRDYIAPSGSPIVTGIVFAVLAAQGVREFPVLKWNNRDRIYTLVLVEIDKSEVEDVI